LYRVREDDYQQITHCRYESRKFSSFDAIIANSWKKSPARRKQHLARETIEAAGFGVAGPALDNRVKATNLPWTVDGAALAGQLATDHIILLNDLEATGYGLALLDPSEISTLNRGVPSPRATQALICRRDGVG